MALSVGNNNADTTFTGMITGPGSLTKIGGGTLTLAGTDDYTGGTTVLGGTLDILSADALPGGTMLTLIQHGLGGVCQRPGARDPVGAVVD